MRSHEENRLKVCAPCGKKIILNEKKKSISYKLLVHTNPVYKIMLIQTIVK